MEILTMARDNDLLLSLPHEEAIVWEEDISKLDYVRQVVVEAGTRRRGRSV